MSTFNNRSTRALNIHKRFSTLELTNGTDCESSEWGRSVNGKIKGGMMLQGTLLANSLINNGNTTVEGNVTVAGKINGNLIGDYMVENYQYEGRYDGNVKGCFDVIGNLIVVGRLQTPNPEIITSYLGNCITDEDVSSIACANNNETITFRTNGNVVATMNSNAAWETGKGKAIGDFSYAEGGTAGGQYSHSEGTMNTIEGQGHVEGANNISESGVFVAGYSNKAVGPISIGHIEGILNTSDATYVHIEGEASNVSMGSSVCVSGFGHKAVGCTNTHIEGFQNTAIGLENSHVEGRLNVVGNVSATSSTALHVEGSHHTIGKLSVGHVEGGYCAVSNVTNLTNSWAGGHSAKINQSYEWVRSAGKINVTGDAQTGIYTLHRTQFDSTPRALGFTDTTPTGSALGITVQDNHCHIYEFNVAGRTNDNPTDYYSCNVLVVVKRDSGVYTIDSHTLQENARGHFSGTSNLVSVGTTGVIAGSFSLLMDGNPGPGQEIYWAASAISTQVS